MKILSSPEPRQAAWPSEGHLGLALLPMGSTEPHSGSKFEHEVFWSIRPETVIGANFGCMTGRWQMDCIIAERVDARREDTGDYGRSIGRSQSLLSATL